MLLRNPTVVFSRDAEAWGLTARQSLVIALFPLLATCAIVATVPFHGLFRWVIDEDSLVESLQLLMLLAADVLLAWLSKELIRARRHVFSGLYVLLTLATFFIAGEEISWGQRIFGFRTPETLESINAQQEISVHNIYGFHQPFIYAVMFAGLYGAVVPLLALGLGNERTRPSLSYLLIPPLCLIPAFLIPFGYRLLRLVFLSDLSGAPGYLAFAITEFSEVTELSLYFGLLVFAWLSLRRLRGTLP
jgi:hypothetical protein